MARFSSSDPYFLIGTWFGEDQRAKLVKAHVKERLDYESLNINNYSTLNIEYDPNDICIQSINQQTYTLPITMATSREV